MIWKLATGVLGAGVEVVRGWQTRKKVRLENELLIAKASTEAKIKRLETKQEGDIAWENTSIKNAGWKDEWFTVILSIPAVMCFVPQLAPFVEEGFKALAFCPEWYKWAFLVAVSSSFGYKKLADFMALKKGS